jgi:hypothetical protein
VTSCGANKTAIVARSSHPFSPAPSAHRFSNIRNRSETEGRYPFFSVELVLIANLVSHCSLENWEL